MIEQFTKVWAEHQDEFRDLCLTHPDDYDDLVKGVIKILHKHCEGGVRPDPNLVHQIDDGGHSGTLVFVIGDDDGYAPDTYWYLTISYGSCSGCDTLELIREYSDDPPDEAQQKQYLQLLCNIVQWLEVMN